MRYFLQLTSVGSVHFHDCKGVLVIFLLDVSGDSCHYYVLHLVFPLYCGVLTTETILDQLCVACEPKHLVCPVFVLLEEYDCVGVRLVRVDVLFHSITVSSVNVPLRYSLRR